MSYPRYTISLTVGNMTYSRKMKSMLGDYHGLQQEILQFGIKGGGWANMAEKMSDCHGGLDAMKHRWNEEYNKQFPPTRISGSGIAERIW